jgi:phosphoribosylamine--glycine ligase
MKFIFFSEYGETLDLALYMSKVMGHDVVMHIINKDYQCIGKGLIKHVDEWYDELGKGRVWVFDSCTFGRFQDFLRESGEFVFGGCELGDELENNRQLNQEWFKSLGFKQPKSRNFKSIADAKQYVQEHSDKRWILKQNGSAPKSINHMGKFDNSVDMLYHLDELTRSWNAQKFGEFDCDLMEVVKGVEVAASAFFNGTDFLRNKDGRIAGYLNFEEKKEADDGLGETCGEMGTTFIGVDDSNSLFKAILGKRAIADKLRDIGFRGVFDINCIVIEDTDQIVALEPTMRFGIPATSYELIEGLDMDPALLINAVARGESIELKHHTGPGMVMCVVAKPFPIDPDEGGMDDRATSLGERLWILGKDGQPVPEFTDRQREHIHLFNFEYNEPTSDDPSGAESCYKVATKQGYMLTCTARRSTIKATRNYLIQYIRDNIYLPGMKWRSDIGERIEEDIDGLY